MPWLIFAVGAVLFWSIGRVLSLRRAQIGALTLAGGLGNTSFVGLPSARAAGRREAAGIVRGAT